jgi:uncharacterized protein
VTLMRALNVIAMVLVIVGAISLGSMGFLGFNLIGWVFGAVPLVARVICAVAGIAAIWGITLIAPLTREACEQRPLRAIASPTMHQ